VCVRSAMSGYSLARKFSSTIIVFIAKSMQLTRPSLSPPPPSNGTALREYVGVCSWSKHENTKTTSVVWYMYVCFY
jgi:hypothetical protein